MEKNINIENVKKALEKAEKSINNYEDMISEKETKIARTEYILMASLIVATAMFFLEYTHNLNFLVSVISLVSLYFLVYYRIKIKQLNKDIKEKNIDVAIYRDIILKEMETKE